jgi:diaminobutyrate-2-oxoglutarate transaminase
MRGLGLMSGLRFAYPGQAEAVARETYRRQVLIETAGPNDDVLKLMPPLSIPEDMLRDGLDRIARAVEAVLCPAQSESQVRAA